MVTFGITNPIRMRRALNLRNRRPNRRLLRSTRASCCQTVSRVSLRQLGTSAEAVATIAESTSSVAGMASAQVHAHLAGSSPRRRYRCRSRTTLLRLQCHPSVIRPSAARAAMRAGRAQTNPARLAARLERPSKTRRCCVQTTDPGSWRLTLDCLTYGTA